jgi:alpha/beta superfamily hydrolase
MKVFFAAVIALFVLGGISAQLASNQSSSGCNVQDAPAQLLSADPVYADAIDVANTLKWFGSADKMHSCLKNAAHFYRAEGRCFLSNRRR